VGTAALPSVYDAPQIDVFFPTPERQSRLVVFFRPLLVLPHMVVLCLIVAVGLVLTIVGWFAALVLGRLPRWIASYQAHGLEYYARVYAWLMFLDGRFPPFRWELGGYPVTTRIQQSRVTRWSVLFRVILVIPARIASSVVFAGATIALPLVLVLVLIRGRLPETVHYALACVLRYQIRFDGYALMVTSVYPIELMGDGSVARFPEERGWRLPLTAGARRLLRLFVVLGLGYVAFMGYLGYRNAQHQSLLASRDALVTAYNELGVATSQFSATAAACARRATRLACVQKAEPPLADEVDRFTVKLDAVRVPAFPLVINRDKGAVYEAANEMAKNLRKAAATTTASDYSYYASRAAAAANRIDAAMRRLIVDLS
jgi:hypothetical protein